MEKKTKDTLLIGFDFSDIDGSGVLIVGRENDKGTVDIVNAFGGEDAKAMYELLITKQ